MTNKLVMTDSALLGILKSRKGCFPFSRHKKGYPSVIQRFVRKYGWLPVQIYKRFLVCVEKQLEFAGRGKRIKSESRSGILYKAQEKAMEKTITKLCFMLAMLHLVGMADGVSIASKGRLKSRLKGKLIIFWKKLKLRWNRARLHGEVAWAIFFSHRITRVKLFPSTINTLFDAVMRQALEINVMKATYIWTL